METLHCPACLSRLRDGGGTHCPECRAPVSGRARPLALLERELQARIEAKTATRYRQRRRAAKSARRIAALPPTLLHHDAVERMEDERPAATPTRVSPTIVDLPATAVLTVRSTSVIAEEAEEAERPIVVEDRAPRRRSRRRTVSAARHVTSEVVEDAVLIEEPALIVEPEPIDEPEPIEELESTEERVAPEPEIDVEPPVKLASITRISPPPTNPVWKDRVFNSARRRPETVSWPRPRPTVSNRPAESVADRFGGAAG